MMKSPKHAIHFEVNNMGAIKLLSRWMRRHKVAKTDTDGKGQLYCFTRSGDFAGKIIFCNQALTGRAIREIGKYQRTLQEQNNGAFLE